jgi:hypothetical protein
VPFTVTEPDLFLSATVWFSDCTSGGSNALQERCGKSWIILETIGKMNEHDLYMLDFLDLDSTEGKMEIEFFQMDFPFLSV